MRTKPNRQAVARRWLMVIAVAGLILIGIFAIWLIIDTGSRIVMRPRPSAAERQSAAAMKIPLATIRPLVRLTPSDSPPIPLATVRPPVKLKSFPIEPATIRPPVSLTSVPIEPATIGSPRTAAPGVELATLSRPTLTRLPDVATLDGIIDEVKPPPRLEIQRRKAESNRDGPDAGLRIVTGFECSTPLVIEKVSDSHFKIKITTEGFRNWFMFRVEGVPEGGATVRIDIEDAPLVKWWSLNPVYSYVTDLSDPAAFATVAVNDPREPVAAHNGPLLPDTRGQKWHYIADVWSAREGRRRTDGPLHMVQHFEADAFVAMRVPYTVGYNEAYLASLEGREGVDVIEVGKTAQGRPLHIVRIGTGDPTQTPCVLMYAREHASEHDTSWAVHGAIEYLLSDEAREIGLLDRITFLLIPMLDPVGAAESQYDSNTHSFFMSQKTVESTAFARWSKQWIDDGNRLDLVINLHNVESAETPHVAPAIREPAMERYRLSRAFDELHLRPSLEMANVSMAKADFGKATSKFRFGGYLASFYGPLHLPFEVNSQEKHVHLEIAQVRKLGRIFIEASDNFAGDDALLRPAVTTILELRRHRKERFGQKIGKESSDPIRFEWALEIEDGEEKHRSEISRRSGPPTWSE